MNLRQMHYFVAVVDKASMTRAAEFCNVAQTALSMQIRQLEEELGVALLVRHSRGVEPTRAGHKFYARAREMLKLADETRADVRAADGGESETIRLGVTPALLMFLGHELAVTIRGELPHVVPVIIEDMSHILIESFAAGQLDCILCYDVPSASSRKRMALLQDDLVFVGQPRQPMGEAISFSAVLQEKLAMPEDGDSIRELAARLARENQLPFNVEYEIRSIPVMKQLAQRGAANCILPFFSVAGEFEKGALDARPITSPPLRRTLYLAYASRSGPFRCEEALASIVRDALRPLIERLGPLAHSIEPGVEKKPA